MLKDKKLRYFEMTEVTEKQNGAGDAAKVATKPTVSVIMLIKRI